MHEGASSAGQDADRAQLKEAGAGRHQVGHHSSHHKLVHVADCRCCLQRQIVEVSCMAIGLQATKCLCGLSVVLAWPLIASVCMAVRPSADWQLPLYGGVCHLLVASGHEPLQHPAAGLKITAQHAGYDSCLQGACSGCG